MSKEKRQTWDEYFMNIARMVATRSTCPRKFVGAVIVKNNNILSTGYNGSMSGAPHCTDVGCMMEGDHCVATIHAESNAIIHSARHGISMEGSSLYVTASPCWNCFKMIANSGIKKICYGEFYRDNRTLEWADKLGISLVHIPIENLELPIQMEPDISTCDK
jgi:dCMP deaminase